MRRPFWVAVPAMARSVLDRGGYGRLNSAVPARRPGAAPAAAARPGAGPGRRAAAGLARGRGYGPREPVFTPFAAPVLPAGAPSVRARAVTRPVAGAPAGCPGTPSRRFDLLLRV